MALTLREKYQRKEGNQQGQSLYIERQKMKIKKKAIIYDQ